MKEKDRAMAASSPAEKKRLPFFRSRKRTFLTLLLLVPLMLCLLYWLFGFVAFADAASLVALKGVVQTRQEVEAQWQPATLNQLLWREHRVRTGDNSSARLLFFDVSTVDLDERTEVSISQVARRHGGNGVDVVLKVWLGKTAVRAVRFVDPASAFRVETPNAATVVRGARFTVQVTEDGVTQLDLEEGSAEVEVGEQVIALEMGQRITLQSDGLYHTEQLFEPDPQPVYDKVEAAWTSSGSVFRLQLTEGEVNQLLATLGQQPDFFLRDTQVWFLDDEARLATTVVEPAQFDLSAALDARVIDGQLAFEVRSVAAGVVLPIPKAVLSPALEWLLNQSQDYLVQAHDFVEFDEVRIRDGYLVVFGRKQPDAPVGP